MQSELQLDEPENAKRAREMRELDPLTRTRLIRAAGSKVVDLRGHFEVMRSDGA